MMRALASRRFRPPIVGWNGAAMNDDVSVTHRLGEATRAKRI